MKPEYHTSRRLLVLFCFALMIAGSSQAYSTGIGTDQDDMGDVAIAGCTCHAENPDNSITVILDDVPYRYSAGTIYQMAIQLIGGPEIDTESNTAGFSMRVSAGTLSGAEGFEIGRAHV